MSNTSAVYARIDKELKESAEEILSVLGISPSSAIQMFYSQIILQNGIPFELRIPQNKPLVVGNMSRSELDFELQRGLDSAENGKSISSKEVNEILNEKIGL